VDKTGIGKIFKGLGVGVINFLGIGNWFSGGGQHQVAALCIVTPRAWALVVTASDGFADDDAVHARLAKARVLEEHRSVLRAG
jgi:hypothetical protein